MRTTRERWRRAGRRVAAVACALALAFVQEAGAGPTLAIGTAGVMGVYHPLGAAVCRIVNVTRKTHGLRCTVETSQGSVANIRGVLVGTFAMGIAQGDTQFAARTGVGPFRDAAQPKLRALFSVYPETLTIVARDGLGITTIDDLKGKRVGIGTPDSGTRVTLDLVFEALGIRRDQLKAALEPEIVAMPPLLCENRMDAFGFVAGHPNPILEDATAGCRAHILPVAGPGIDALVASHPHYFRTVVPGGIYRGNPLPQPTIGTMASIVVSADLPDDVAYAITRTIFENFDDFRKLHPALAALTRAQALAGNAVPFHPGAERYFREAGLR